VIGLPVNDEPIAETYPESKRIVRKVANFFIIV